MYRPQRAGGARETWGPASSFRYAPLVDPTYRGSPLHFCSRRAARAMPPFLLKARCAREAFIFAKGAPRARCLHFFLKARCARNGLHFLLKARRARSASPFLLKARCARDAYEQDRKTGEFNTSTWLSGLRCAPPQPHKSTRVVEIIHRHPSPLTLCLGGWRRFSGFDSKAQTAFNQRMRACNACLGFSPCLKWPAVMTARPQLPTPIRHQSTIFGRRSTFDNPAREKNQQRKIALS